MEALRLPEPLTHLKERQAPMSRLARTLVLGAMLAMTLTAMTAIAQAQPTGNDSVKRAADAQERYYSTWSYGDTTSDSVKRAADAQERYYSTWGYGDTSAPAPAQPSGQPGWLVPAIGVLAAALALLGVLAAMLVRRARGRVRVRHAA
jgi:hypothetical protein